MGPARPEIRVMQAIKDRFDPQEHSQPRTICIRLGSPIPSMNHNGSDNSNRPPEPGRGDRLRSVPALRSLRAVYVELSDVYRSGRRERRPARPHPTDADGGRRPHRADRPHAPPPGIVPRLPVVRDGVSLGRALRPADRAVPPGRRAGRLAAGSEIRLVPRDHPVPAVSLRRADAQAADAGAADAADSGCSIWPSGWGC